MKYDPSSVHLPPSPGSWTMPSEPVKNEPVRVVESATERAVLIRFWSPVTLASAVMPETNTPWLQV
nr:hypothetical protein [Amycolatopsis rubida]